MRASAKRATFSGGDAHVMKAASLRALATAEPASMTEQLKPAAASACACAANSASSPAAMRRDLDGGSSGAVRWEGRRRA